jgi:hypothetical protein
MDDIVTQAVQYSSAAVLCVVSGNRNQCHNRESSPKQHLTADIATRPFPVRAASLTLHPALPPRIWHDHELLPVTSHLTTNVSELRLNVTLFYLSWFTCERFVSFPTKISHVSLATRAPRPCHLPIAHFPHLCQPLKIKYYSMYLLSNTPTYDLWSSLQN